MEIGGNAEEKKVKKPLIYLRALKVVLWTICGFNDFLPEL